eukprot:CAMPEP_0119363820 /NCGR_PEP_ID=MMETSP1334-20130426/10741_1 /TAXON_ID=127549 /ORGANISM="Calcidiscus leptoporus, Strain RCC1130" /LENGTH=208 /DNA_ID=CAMNT_0007379367 /DNA_START=16 /DNA_END=642 /DNA_ORIENTATION=-
MGKGVSAEEKRTRLLEMFTKSGAVFTLKDVEKGASSVGIMSQAVKDVLKQLTDDDFVREEKVGISTYYWSFPAEAATKRRNELQSLKRERALLEQQVDEARTTLREQQQNAEQQKESPSDQRLLREAEEAVAALRSELEATKTQVQTMRSASALDLHARKADIPKLRDAANRWTDNIFEARKQVINRFGLNGADVDKQLELPSLDYID